MKINEIIVESVQLDEAGLIKTAAKGVGKAVGGVAKGIGAVAGGIAAIPGAVKKGYQAGKAAVQGDDSGNPSPNQTQANLAATGNPVGAPSNNQKPAAKKSMSSFGKLAAAAGLTGNNEPDEQPAATAAKPQQSKTPAARSTNAKPAAAKPATTSAPQQAPAASTPAVQSAYAQVKANVDKLDKKGKQRILQALEKELGPVATKPKASAAQPTNKPGALGSLVQQQLATAKTKTATGGTVTNPKPGVTVHKASPNNPNLANA